MKSFFGLSQPTYCSNEVKELIFFPYADIINWILYMYSFETFLPFSVFSLHP